MYYKPHESLFVCMLIPWNGFLPILGKCEYVIESVNLKDGLFTLKYNSLQTLMYVLLNTTNQSLCIDEIKMKNFRHDLRN